MQRKAVGERLATIRGSQGMSQREMGQALEISWRSYQNYELGTREPPTDVVLKLCQKFSFRVPWLVYGTGGSKSYDSLDELRDLLCLFDQTLESMGRTLTTEKKADVVARLIKRAQDGLAVSVDEIRDYVELAGANK